MHRRTLIKWAVAAASTVSLGGAAGAWFLRASRSPLQRLIETKLSFLELDRGGVAAFVRDLAEASARGAPIISLSQAYAALRAAGPPRSGTTRGGDDLVRLYLRSTNFAANGFDESQPVRYVALFDPWRPCR